MKRFTGLVWEDLKNKLGMTAALWYSMGMLCLVFSMKTTIPRGEVRSLYVGPGNTSFFAVTILFGVLMGVSAFRFLDSESRTDLYFGLPFTRRQLFAAGWLNNLFLFAVPLVICRLCFFRISLAMGYSRYEESILPVGMGCLVSVLGFLFVMDLVMLAYLLGQNDGYRIGLFLLLLAGPAAGVRLTEKLLRAMAPSFYRSEILELLTEYLSPLSLLSRAASVREYADGADWILGEHLPYIFALAAAAGILTILNLVIFCIRPAERRNGMFTFLPVEYLVRYIGVILAAAWFVNGLQAFAPGGFSMPLAVIAMLFGVPLIHGLANMVIAFDARKFISAKWHLLAELCMTALMIGGISILGNRNAGTPPEAEAAAMAVVLPALASGADDEQALSQMRIEGDALSDTYEWIQSVCAEEGREEDSYELLARYELKNGRSKYFRYWIPAYAIAAFDEVFRQEEYKLGTYEALGMDGVKYYEAWWTNGMEEYMLDFDEQERQELLAAYQADLKELDFAQIRLRTPLGRLIFASTKNQGDVSGYIYPDFSKTLQILSRYGIPARKEIEDYEITKIEADHYLWKDGLLYNVRYLADQQTITDPQKIAELSKELYVADFCVDEKLNLKNQNTEYTVYYRDSAGQTVKRVKCRKGL